MQELINENVQDIFGSVLAAYDTKEEVHLLQRQQSSLSNWRIQYDS